MLKTCAKKYIALALVLLQFTIPFLHAHSGNDLSPDGFHIHGLNLVNHDGLYPAVKALDSAVSIDGLIVSVGSVLQNDQRDIESLDSLYAAPGFTPSNLYRKPRPIKFSDYVVIDKLQTFYRSSSPRSPPA